MLFHRKLANLVRRALHHRTQNRKLDRVLASFETIAKPGQTIAGGRMTTADLVLGVALQYLDFRHTPDWRKAAPRLAEWSRALLQRPS